MRPGRVFATLLLIALPLTGNAQSSRFAAAITVDDRAITYYEIDQRRRLLRALSAGSGDLESQAREALIDERLQQIAADRAGIELDDEAVDAAIGEFAARGNMDRRQLLGLLAGAGVEQETFRDFVRNRQLWRGVVRSLFLSEARISEAEIDRALTLSQSGSGALALLSEIIIPLPPRLPDIARENRGLAQDLSRSIRSPGEFAQAARYFSVSQTSDRGGSLGWVPLGRLPPQISSLVLSLEPGEVTQPVELQNALGIFRFGGLREQEFRHPQTLSAEYLSVQIPGGQSPAARQAAANLAGKLDTCDDFYGHNKDFSEEAWRREVQPIAEIPTDIALELARLDAGEVSASLTRGPNLLFLMLCGRTTELASVDRENVRQQLFSQRLESYADSYLDQLRADALIIER